MSSVKITRMQDEHIHDAARIISRSFQTENFTNHMYDFSDPKTKSIYFDLLKIELKVFKKFNEKINVALFDGEVAGVYVVKTTDKSHAFTTLRLMAPKLLTVAPILKRLKYKNLLMLYSAWQKPKNIPDESVLLEILAVDPEFQGKGVGRALMNDLDEYSRVTGRPIYLYTANTENKKYYKKLGYETLYTSHKPDFTAFHMLKDLNDK